jgi:glutaredoxin 3
VITLYTKTTCPFCVQAKALLDRWEVAYETVNIEEDETARDFIVNEGHRTVPQIYHNGKVLVEGGYNGLEKLTKTELNERLGNIDVSNFKL